MSKNRRNVSESKPVRLRPCKTRRPGDTSDTKNRPYDRRSIRDMKIAKWLMALGFFSSVIYGYYNVVWMLEFYVFALMFGLSYFMTWFFQMWMVNYGKG